MTVRSTDPRLHRRLIDQLYVEAMLLADEARSYFDEGGRADREALEALTRVTFSCEALKVTTRLMHIIAWVLTQRAVEAGELSGADALAPSRRLGPAPATDPAVNASMPPQAQALITASIELHARIDRIEHALVATDPPPNPARLMQARLSGLF